MIIADMHTHSHFSGDCKATMDEMVSEAIKKGLKYYAITEHHDIEFPECGIDFELNTESYIRHITSYKEKMPKDFELLIGMEYGMQPHLVGILDEMTERYPFDFIIGSNHLAANGKDPYQADYYDGLTRNQGYMLYFEAILASVTHFDSFDTLGHMDYVNRYWRKDDIKIYNYSEFADIIDAILRTLIRKDKALEVNTMGNKHKLNGPNPSYEVLSRYFELGGELLTIGSDAHTPGNIGYYFDETEAKLREIGFKSYTVFKKRQPIQIPF